jgi:hypothetical protein
MEKIKQVSSKYFCKHAKKQKALRGHGVKAIRGKRYVIDFNRIRTPRFTIDV